MFYCSEKDLPEAFARMDQAGRGSIRLENADQWVALVHFSSRDELSDCGPIKQRYHYFTLYRNGNRAAHYEAAGNVTYGTFSEWLAGHTGNQLADLLQQER